MFQVLRILDANANRAREALRVMEEAARFVLDNAQLCEQLKSLRHDLAAALADVPNLSANRNTVGDVGTAISTEREGQRHDVADVAAAAGKRLSEAFRVMEEYGKLLDKSAAGFAPAIEAMRYRGYSIEQRLNETLSPPRSGQWRLCVLLTESLCTRHTWQDVLDAALDGGADCVQLREKQLDGGLLLQRAEHVVSRCRDKQASVIINDRPDVAVASGADGVHLGQGDLPCAAVGQLADRPRVIGVSTSEIDQAKRALADGADYCGVGPMFATTTKHKPVLAGPDYLRKYLVWDRLPHLAIGGISPDNIGLLAEAGVRGVAVASAVCSAQDPAAVVAKLLDAMTQG